MRTMTTDRPHAVTSVDVGDILALIHALPPVEPDEHAALRSAVAGVTLAERPYTPPTPIERPLRVAEVADLLGVHPATVRKLLAAGSLTGYRLSPNPGSDWRVPPQAVRDFIARGMA